MSLVKNAFGTYLNYVLLLSECVEQRKPVLLLLLEAPSFWAGGLPGVTQLGGKQLMTPGIHEVT